MALCTMKNHSPLTLMAAALLGAAAATMLLTHEPLGLSLTPRLEMDLRKTQVRAPASQKMTSLHLAALGSRLSDVGFGFGVASSNSNSDTRARARAACAARDPLIYRGIYHSKCHLMPLMSPLLHNRGASSAAGMGPSSMSTVRWTMNDEQYAP